MKFVILAGRSNQSEVVVTGYLKGSTEDEKELLKIIQEEFKAIKTYNERVSIKDGKLMFKAVPMRLLKQTLNYLATTLAFELKYVISKEFTGDEKIRKLLEKSIVQADK